MRAALLSGLVVVIALATACAEEAPPVSGADELGATLVPVGEHEAVVSPGTSDAGCTSMEVDTVVVGETFVNAATPPDPLGGELPSGTFVLTDITRFQTWTRSTEDDDQPNGAVPVSSYVAEKLLVVDGSTYRFAARTGTKEQGIGDAVEVTSGTLASKGTSVLLSQGCPSSGSLTLGYTVVGSTISIYTSPDRRETYIPAP